LTDNSQAVIVGLLDNAKRPGVDGERGAASLAFCDQVRSAGTADEARAALAGLPSDTWILLLRNNEWLADDAGLIIRQACDAAADVIAVRLRYAGTIGEQEIQHSLFAGYTGTRLTRLDAMVVNHDTVGLALQAAADLSIRDEDRVTVHGCLAADLASFSEKVLPGWPLPEVVSPAVALSEFFAGLASSAGRDGARMTTSPLSWLVSLAVLQRRIAQGLFDQAPQLLASLTLLGGVSGSETSDRDELVRSLRASHRDAMEHARHHLEVASRELAETRTQWAVAQQQVAAYGQSIVGRVARWWIHRSSAKRP
jgi:hypothetical protein